MVRAHTNTDLIADLKSEKGSGLDVCPKEPTSRPRNGLPSDHRKIGQTHHTRMVIAVPVNVAVREMVRVVVVGIHVDPELAVVQYLRHRSVPLPMRGRREQFRRSNPRPQPER